MLNHLKSRWTHEISRIKIKLLKSSSLPNEPIVKLINLQTETGPQKKNFFFAV